MKIDETLLTKLESLCALKIESEKREKIMEQLSEVVSFVDNLNELNLDDENTTFTTIEGGTPLREDVPSQAKEVVDIILKHAPNSNENFFVVPSIIE